jgi:hypothetical protein
MIMMLFFVGWQAPAVQTDNYMSVILQIHFVYYSPLICTYVTGVTDTWSVFITLWSSRGTDLLEVCEGFPEKYIIFRYWKCFKIIHNFKPNLKIVFIIRNKIFKIISAFEILSQEIVLLYRTLRAILFERPWVRMSARTPTVPICFVFFFFSYLRKSFRTLNSLRPVTSKYFAFNHMQSSSSWCYISLTCAFETASFFTQVI